jgi:hypothetical protein
MTQDAPGTVVGEIVHFAVMTDQNVTIQCQRTAGHWYIEARRADGSELAFECRSWNEAQHLVAVALRQVVRTG